MPHLTITDQEHIHKIKDQLVAKYGELIHQVICFGSRVSKQVQDTDFDVMIVTSEKIDWRKEDEISDVFFYYGIDNDILFHCIFYSQDEYYVKYSFMPLITEVKTTGLVI